jgi:hypothetical protein
MKTLGGVEMKLHVRIILSIHGGGRRLASRFARLYFRERDFVLLSISVYALVFIDHV